LVAFVCVVSGCGVTQDGPTEIRIREVQMAGAPRTEGERTLVRIEGRTYELRPDRELRVRLRGARHTLEVRRGGVRCSRSVAASEETTTLATIRRFADVTSPTLGRIAGAPCRIVAGKIGITYRQNEKIWFASRDGSSRVRLAAAGSDGPEPVLSPDGRWVAFVRVRPHAVDVSLVATAGGPPSLLRRLPAASVSDLVWAPDSRLLAASTDDGLYFLHPDAPSSGFRIATVATGPTFSPDGSWIAYATHRGTGDDIYASPISGGETRRVTRHRHGSVPRWGRKGLVFSQGRDLWRVDIPGTRPRQFTRTGAWIFPLAWSADGTRLLAASVNFRYERLWTIDGATGEVHQLKNWALGLWGQGLSYDGQTILAATGCAGPSIPRGEPRGTIETIPFHGGKPRVILKGPCSASWNG